MHENECSPRERGWSRVIQDALQGRCMFPARAGVVLGHKNSYDSILHVPRVSRGGPLLKKMPAGDIEYSPHKRVGGSGCGKYSLHRQGWSFAADVFAGTMKMFPAGAGLLFQGTKLRDTSNTHYF